jgi:hypothetical protein
VVFLIPRPGISFGIAAAKALAEGKVDGIWANVLVFDQLLIICGGSRIC